MLSRTVSGSLVVTRNWPRLIEKKGRISHFGAPEDAQGKWTKFCNPGEFGSRTVPPLRLMHINPTGGDLTGANGWWVRKPVTRICCLDQETFGREAPWASGPLEHTCLVGRRRFPRGKFAWTP